MEAKVEGLSPPAAPWMCFRISKSSTQKPQRKSGPKSEQLLTQRCWFVGVPHLHRVALPLGHAVVSSSLPWVRAGSSIKPSWQPPAAYQLTEHAPFPLPHQSAWRRKDSKNALLSRQGSQLSLWPARQALILGVAQTGLSSRSSLITLINQGPSSHLRKGLPLHFRNCLRVSREAQVQTSQPRDTREN